MVDDFLDSLPPRMWTAESSEAECDLFIGNGSNALEIVATSQDDPPTKQFLQRLYRDRRSGRVSPVLVVVFHSDGAEVDVCGPVGEDPEVQRGLGPKQAERICAKALDQPDRHAAQRFCGESSINLTTIMSAFAIKGSFPRTNSRSAFLTGPIGITRALKRVGYWTRRTRT